MTPVDMNGSCLARIRAAIQQESGATTTIGRFILKSPFRARNMSINALARACRASAATVYRFCRDLGYDGYKEFQLDLAAAVAKNDIVNLEDFAEDASPRTIIRNVFEFSRRSLSDTERILDDRILIQLARTIQRCRRVLFLGIGGSGLVARFAAYRLLSLGFTAIAVDDPIQQIFATENVGPGDVVVGISHTGQSATVVEALQRARKKGARTVSLTNYPHSPLATEAMYRLPTAFHEHRINAAISSSIVAQLSVIHSLYFILGSWGSRKAKKYATEAERRSQRLLRASRAGKQS